jgi:hypothetical protein
MRPARRTVFPRDSPSAFILRLAESEGFLFSGFALVSQSPPVPHLSCGTTLKDQYMKKFCLALATAGFFLASRSLAISLDDIQLWTGSGTNRAALVIEWSTPESLTYSSVPVPVTDKTLVWGYRFNGASTATQMLDAIVAADPRLYVVEDNSFGTFVVALGYNLNHNSVIGITDGTGTNFFINGFLTQATVNVDAARAINNGDLYWGGLYGPNWEVWNELGDSGGFLSSPNRGTNEYWTPTDLVYYSAGTHGQWEFAQAGLDDLPLTNGSWIAFSVAAGEFESSATAPYNIHKHAPPSPDGTYAAYVYNSNDFAVQIASTNNVYAYSPYNSSAAVLGRPTLRFLDHFGGNAVDRTKIIESAYWTATNGSDVITEITPGGQITVNMGRKVYDAPNNPYGIDLIVYGNSFFSASGVSGVIGDFTDLNSALLSSGFYGHSTTVSVSQDGTNWFNYPNTSALFPDNAYRWDDTNQSWTAEESWPTKPLNPSVYTMSFNKLPAASAQDQFNNSAGGTGFDLKASGYPWIQYVRVQPGPGSYTVIDAIAAVDPVVVGDALTITPDNLACGIDSLAFQEPDNSSNTLISINFDSVSSTARVSTVSLSEFSAFAPVPGGVSSAYQITLKPLTVGSSVTYAAQVGLRAADNYTGNGSDLRVYQWQGTNWISQPFTFNPACSQAVLTGVTNFSAFVVSQIVPPRLCAQAGIHNCCFQFTPVPNCVHTLLRTLDFKTWTPVAAMTPANSQPVTLQDNAPPAGRAFYRLSIAVP